MIAPGKTNKNKEEKDMELSLAEQTIRDIDLKGAIGKLQNDFFQTNWGQAINKGIDFGLKAILPNFIENEIIEIKNAFIKEGLVEGIKTAIEVTINKGKELIGMFTGDLENMSQAEAIAKNGDLIKNVEKTLDNVVDKCVKNNLIKEGLGALIKEGKNSMLDYAKNNVDKVNKEQVKKIQEMDEFIKDWEEAFKNQDFKKMNNAYIKINRRMESVLPIKETLEKAEVVENLHNLIKNNGKDFNLSEEQLELAKQLIL